MPDADADYGASGIAALRSFFIAERTVVSGFAYEIEPRYRRDGPW